LLQPEHFRESTILALCSPSILEKRAQYCQKPYSTARAF
jgi:hypothetical protein